MGVLGLWKLVDATGKPVPLETLEGKVLAIDISIWIHQVIQGYQDRRGNALPNAHLIGLFNRICKLMYFKIKPVFVFDGGVPLLKKNTIATRRKLKSIAATKAQKLKNDLINNLIKHTAVKGALEKGNDEEESSNTVEQFKDAKASGSTTDLNDMYKLPDMPSTSVLNSDDYMVSEDEDDLKLSPRKQAKWMGNIHSVDVDNEEFKNLPADIRYDILTDLKETRKQNSWGRLHELPKGSNNYSGFQVKRLLKRRYVQESLEVAEKEMGGKTLTLEELDRLLTDQGINTTLTQDKAFRIASDNVTRVIYLKDSKSSQDTQNSNDSGSSKRSNSKEVDPNTETLSDSMSINSENSTAVINDLNAYDLDDEWNSDEDFKATIIDSPLPMKNDISKSDMNPALAYMLENTGFTRDQILKIVKQQKKNRTSSDAASSTNSAQKRNEKRKSRRLSIHKKRKLSFEIETTDVKSFEKTKKVLNEPVESSSDSDDFVEVSEKTIVKQELMKNDSFDKTPIKESSEDESDDFVEVQDVPIPELTNKKLEKNSLQIIIKAGGDLEDDIFADVFSNVNTIEKTVQSPEEKKESKKISIVSAFQSEREKQMKALEKVKSELKAIKEQFEIEETSNEIPISSTSEKIQTDDSYTSQSELPQRVVDSSTIGKFVEKITSAETEKKIETETNEYFETVQNKIEKIDNDYIVNVEDFTDSDFTMKINSTEESVTEKVKEDDKILEADKQPAIVFPTDEKELESMKQQLENEQQQITGNLGKLERQAIDITDQMRIEAQELLQLFGVPYIVAPMEAEAQCAYLEQIHLTDGTITDDSDVWLFGGHCVYKNFFDNNKRVLQFLSSDIEHHFKLSRREMIQLALLVGSDYTNGLAGVGPVTALEILASFPCDGEDILRGLRSFAVWFRAGKLAAPGKITLRNKLKNVQIEKGFPSQAVVQAYLSPIVDESKEPFTWSKPNLVLLGDYAKRKFGWTKLKFEEIVNPVMKKYNETQSQKVIESYFKVQHVPKSIETALSKRVQSAVQKLKGQSDENEIEKSSTIKGKVKKPRKTTSKKGKKSKNETGELPAIAKMGENNNSETASTNDDKPESSEINGEDNAEIIELKSEMKLEPTDLDEVKSEVVGSRRNPPKIISVIEEVIPQREIDKLNALKTKLKAIEIYRKSKKGLQKTAKKKKIIKKIKVDAELSEDSSD